MTPTQQSTLIGVQLLALVAAFAGDLFGLAALTAVGVGVFFLAVAVLLGASTVSLAAAVYERSLDATPPTTARTNR